MKLPNTHFSPTPVICSLSAPHIHVSCPFWNTPNLYSSLAGTDGGHVVSVCTWSLVVSVTHLHKHFVCTKCSHLLRFLQDGLHKLWYRIVCNGTQCAALVATVLYAQNKIFPCLHVSTVNGHPWARLLNVGNVFLVSVYTLITNLMHWLLFIRKILLSSTCFEHQVHIFRRT